MNLIKFFQKHFWFPIVLSLLIGLAFPQFGVNLSYLVIPILMVNFFLSCLKIDFIDVIEHIKRPKFIIYILFLYLLIIPAVIYGVFRFANPELSIAILLLASMPPGVSAVVLTDIFDGNTSLSMAVSILAYLLSPFTVSLLFFILAQKQINFDLGPLFLTLIFVNFVPLFAAQIIRKTKKGLIEKTKDYYTFANILLISFMIYIVIAVQADNILNNILGALIDTIWIYVLFFVMFFLGYSMGYRKSKKDKIALAVSKTYMNNALAIGLAATFFTPHIALLMVLSEIPWTTTLGIFKYITKRLN